MQKQLDAIVEKTLKSVKNAERLKDIEAIKQDILGKNGELALIMKGMKDLSKEERPVFGKLVNDARDKVEQAVLEKEAIFKKSEKFEKLREEIIDITLPAKSSSVGTLHPLNIVKKKIIETFMGMGFSLSEGVEIETDFNNFEALNLPKDHPARDMQDTFYISDNILLRTHTSPAQIRTMMKEKGAIKILSPGRVYRADDDATHSPMFHQIEGLVVDENVSLADLKGLLDVFAKSLFTSKTKTRFRPSYFPFTEPSVEVDVTCTMCGGKGCRVCKGTGWIEVLGGGVVNQRVLENCGIDVAEYRGIAFGIGIERITMIKYGVPDIRLLFENDIRLLKQFK